MACLGCEVAPRVPVVGWGVIGSGDIFDGTEIGKNTFREEIQPQVRAEENKRTMD